MMHSYAHPNARGAAKNRSARYDRWEKSPQTANMAHLSTRCYASDAEAGAVCFALDAECLVEFLSRPLSLCIEKAGAFSTRG